MDAESLSERLLDFAVRVARVVDALPDTRVGRHVAGQLVRCGTSPPSNYEEACAAESGRDFVHKMRVCLKESRETRFWLRFIVKAALLPDHKMADMVKEAHELCNIFGQSIVTAKRNRGDLT